MKKIAAFIVKKRYVVLGAVAALALLCAFLATKVEINSDMTKYLASDSSMRIGMDVMEEEFGAEEESQTIRVMAEGLEDEEKQALLEALEALPYVSSVDHDGGGDYNAGDHSLFVIHTDYAYGSKEEKSIETALEKDFGDYNITWQNDDDSLKLEAWIVAVAVAFLLAVMLAMCESWAEPFLFLAAVGLAVLINAGTNLLLGSVSNITNSVAAILQLVLSMDYSIMLMNRYRQEQALCPDRETAMTRALAHAFSSITSSSLTTIVGLLALVFMSFKIGRDLGLVLAKGVLISLLCIFTALPGMVLVCDRLIQRTAKKTLAPSMKRLAGFSCRFRYGLAAAFLVMFVGFYFAQQNTEPAYTLESADEIAEIFPSESTLVLVYENQDEEAAARLAETLEAGGSVTQVLGYPNLLGKEYTAAELLEAADGLSAAFGMDMDVDIDSAMLELAYYTYYDGSTEALDMSSFLTFLSEDVLENDSFADAIGGEISAQREKLALFASREELTCSMTVQELAGVFDMEEEAVQSLLLYYYAQHGGAETGSMTLGDFVDFVVDEVAQDSDYSGLFDGDALAGLEQLRAYTDRDAVTAGLSYTAMAGVLGLDSATARLLYVYYFATQGGYVPGTMTLREFAVFVQEDVLTDAAFSAYFDGDTAAQLEALALYTDTDAIARQYTAGEIAGILGMEESLVQTVYALYAAGDVSEKTMTLADFTAFLTAGVLESPLLSGAVEETAVAQLAALSGLVQAAASGQELTASGLAGLLGMDQSVAEQLLLLYAMEQISDGEIASATVTVRDFATFLAEDVLTDPAYAAQLGDGASARIQGLYALLQAGTSGRAFTAAELAALTGMEEAVVSQLLLAAAGGGAQDTDAAAGTEAEDAAAAGEEEEAAEAVAGSEEEAEVEDQGTEENIPQETGEAETAAEPAMTLPDFLALVEDYAAYLDGESLAQLAQARQILDLALAGQGLNTAALAQAFGMEEAQGEQMMRLYLARGEQCAALPAFTAYLTGSVLQNETYAAYFDGDTAAQLIQMDRLVQMAAAGAELTASALAQALGMEEETAILVFRLYYGQAEEGTMSLEAFVCYLLEDLASNPLTAAYFNGDIISGLAQAQALMQSALAGTAYTYSGLASLLGMDSAAVKLLYTLHDGDGGQLSSWRVSLATLVDYLLDNSGTFASLMGGSALSQLQTASAVMHGAINGTHYTAGEIASLLGMEAEQAEQLYLLYTSKYGDASTWRLSLHELVDFLAEDVLADEDYAGLLTGEERERLAGAKALADAVLSGEVYAPEACAVLLAALTDEIDENTVELLYLYYASLHNGDEDWRLSIVELFGYLHDTLLADQRFSPWIDEEMRAGIQDMNSALEEGADMLKGENCSRLLIYGTLPDESEETRAFFDGLTAWLEENFQGEYHLVGSAAMVYEMQGNFDGEMTFITLLTAAAIFLVVALTFRSLAVPAILVLLVQCGVYVTITVLGAFGSSVYYLAMLIVECILMGATVDYAILLTNYYREYRASMPVRPALEAAYNGSIHTILTSGLILILVPGVVAYCFAELTIRQICRAISIGALCAGLLILFVLPGLLAAFDRLVTRKQERHTGKP